MDLAGFWGECWAALRNGLLPLEQTVGPRFRDFMDSIEFQRFSSNFIDFMDLGGFWGECWAALRNGLLPLEQTVGPRSRDFMDSIEFHCFVSNVIVSWIWQVSGESAGQP